MYKNNMIKYIKKFFLKLKNKKTTKELSKVAFWANFSSTDPNTLEIKLHK